jgi:hypothetical protein
MSENPLLSRLVAAEDSIKRVNIDGDKIIREKEEKAGNEKFRQFIRSLEEAVTMAQKFEQAMTLFSTEKTDLSEIERAEMKLAKQEEVGSLQYELTAFTRAVAERQSMVQTLDILEGYQNGSFSDKGIAAEELENLAEMTFDQRSRKKNYADEDGSPYVKGETFDQYVERLKPQWSLDSDDNDGMFEAIDTLKKTISTKDRGDWRLDERTVKFEKRLDDAIKKFS